MKQFLPILVIVLYSCRTEPQQTQATMANLISGNMQFAAAQYKVLMRNVPASSMPRTYHEGILVSSGTEWWASGFYPGSLWLIYEYTRDPEIRKEAESRLVLQEKQKRNTSNHDIGFQIFCSFGNAYRITGSLPYKAVIDTAAVYQATRFRPVINAIQSWNKNSFFTCPVIIDNMVNLEQLLWVSANGGSSQYRNMAVAHARTTQAQHFRADNSSYHVVDFDPVRGTVLQKTTWQGAAPSSAWARGQSWGLYGFTLMYRYVRDRRYLDQARNIARFLVRHPNLPADKIPYWDFSITTGPAAYRDASAAAIMASALLELGQYVSASERTEYRTTAEAILQTLSSPAYRATLGTNGGFLLLHSVGNFPANSEVDVPVTYADYYFLEALLRYNRWYLNR